MEEVNALSTQTTRTSVIARPRTIAEAMDLANMLAKSLAVPKAYQAHPQDIFVAIGMGDSLGINPFQALQGIAVINGIPAVYGDLAKALVLETPGIEYFKEWSVQQVDKEGKGHCEIKLKDQEPVIVEFTLEMAKKAGLIGKQGPWTQYQSRMLQLKARAWCMRDAAPGALKGLKIVEEVMDYNDIMAPSVSDMMPKRKEISGPVEQPAFNQAAQPKSEAVSAEQARDLALAAEKHGIDQIALMAHLPGAFGVKFLYEVPKEKFEELMKWIESPK